MVRGGVFREILKVGRSVTDFLLFVPKMVLKYGGGTQKWPKGGLADPNRV